MVAWIQAKRDSQVEIITEAGELISRRIRTTRASLQDFFTHRPKTKVLIEASTESEWVACCLEELGHEVVVADPNYAPMYAQRSRKVKTDRRDARALAEACILGAYRPAHRTSDEQRHVRGLLAAREALVRTRVKLVVIVQTLLRREGIHVRGGNTECFSGRLRELALPELQVETAPLLAVLEPLNQQIASLDKKVEEISRNDRDVARLRTCPQVGPITAAAFVATLDSPERFSGPHQVESYLGLVPREWSSSEVRARAPSPRSDPRGCATCSSRPHTASSSTSAPDLPPVTWAERIAHRRGKKTAVVALARRLGGILYAMWRDQTAYDPAKLGRMPVMAEA